LVRAVGATVAIVVLILPTLILVVLVCTFEATSTGMAISEVHIGPSTAQVEGREWRKVRRLVFELAKGSIREIKLTE
jgi:branched-subunit amino acid ABC-type transport system permease component